MLLNTCSVRDMAEQKALGKMGMLGRVAKQRPEVVFGFLGCMAQARGAELLKLVPHLDLVVGTQKFHRVADYVDELLERKRAAATMDDPRFSIVDTAEEDGSQETIREHALRARQATAFVSIMQGCNMHCTFCIVPRTRGAERSRPIAEIVREVRALVERGVKEVTLLGQIVNLYGRHEFPEARRQEPVRAVARGGARRRWPRAPALHLAASDRFSRGSDRGLARSAKALRARAFAAAIGVRSDSQGDASHLHGGKISSAGRPNPRTARPTSRSRPMSSSASPARRRRITRERARWSSECNSTTLSSFATRSGAKRPRPK